MPASHEPLHSPEHEPSHLAPAWTLQLPLHSASHEPLSLPPSHFTSAEPGLMVASQLAAQSAIASIDAAQRGSFALTEIEALALALMSPMSFAAAPQAASAFLPGPCSFGAISASLAPRSLARPVHAAVTSPSTFADIS